MRKLLLLILSLCLLGPVGHAPVRAQSGDEPAEQPKQEEKKEEDPAAGSSEEKKAVEVQLSDDDGKQAGEAKEGEQAQSERDAAQSGKPPVNAADDSTGESGEAAESSVGQAGASSVRPVDEATLPLPRPEDQSSGLLSAPTEQQSGDPAGTGGTNVAEGNTPEDGSMRELPGVERLGDRLERGTETDSPREGTARPERETPGFIPDGDGEVPDDMAELDELFDLSEFGIDNEQLDMDMTPEEFLERYEQNLEFDSLLPGSRLPEGRVADIIGSQQSRPGIGLMDNYAWLSVPTGNVRGSTETKQFHMEGGVIIYFDEVTISGDEAEVDEKNEIAVLRGNVNIIDPDYTMRTDELRILFNEKKFQATGFVSFKKLADRDKLDPDMSLDPKDRLREYFAAREFELSCNKLFYNWETREMICIENVRMGHPVFSGSMYRIDYDDQSKEYLMSGGIKLEVEEYDWIFDNELAAEDDVQKLEALTDGKTTITCDRLAYDEASGVARFFASPGNQVKFDQPKRNVTASYIEINDETKDFYAEGSVGQKMKYTQTDGEWLFAGGLIDRETVSEDLSETMQEAMEAEALTMEYNFERKRIEMHGEVKVTSGSKVMQAGDLVQDETAKFFLLQDNVLVRPDDESSVYCAQVYVDTENDVFTFVGLVQGSFQNEDLVMQAEAAGTGEVRDDIQSGAFATGPGTNVAEGSRNP